MKVEITSKGAGRRFYFGTRTAGEQVEVPADVGRQMEAQGLCRQVVKKAVEVQPAKAAVIVKENDDG